MRAFFSANNFAPFIGFGAMIVQGEIFGIKFTGALPYSELGLDFISNGGFNIGFGAIVTTGFDGIGFSGLAKIGWFF